MDMNTFKTGLNARLKELNDNEEGYTYYLSSDAKRYYQTTDAKKSQDAKPQPSVLLVMAVPNLVKHRPNTSVRVVEVA